MTYREIINSVLRRLRETTIATDWSGDINDSSVVTDYQKLIGELVNDTKRNCEQYHDWLILRTSVDVTTADGTRAYSLNSGQEIKLLDVVNQDTGHQLTQVSKKYMNSVKYPSSSSGQPMFYAFAGKDSSNNLKIEFDPIPNQVYTVTFDITKPQDDLSLAATELLIPYQPVILGAWARAIAERGEDGGTQSSLAAQEAIAELNKAVILDNSNIEFENDWYVKEHHLNG